MTLISLISDERTNALNKSTIQESEQERIRTLPDFDSSIGVIEWTS